MTCRTGCKISERNWSMNVVLQSHGETLRLRIKTLPILLMNYLWSLEQKCNQALVSTVFILSHRKIPTVISVRGPKLQGRRAEDVLVQSYLVLKFLVTWLLRITKFSVKSVNLETIIDMQSWCKIWQLSGYNHSRVEQKLPRRPRRT